MSVRISDTFFSEFFNVLHDLRGERNHSHIKQCIKTPAIRQREVTSEDMKYATYATPYANSLIVKQLLLRDAFKMPEDGHPCHSSEGHIIVTASSCQCSLWITRRLPCRHIFAYRKTNNIASFDTDLVADRWSACKAPDIMKHRVG